VRITAALAWHDEPPEFLERCVRSLSGLVHEVVAVDGAWRWFQGGTTSSPAEIRAIRDTAAAVGIKSRIIVPQAIFDSQVHKRAYLMEQAARSSDWVFVIDADEWVDQCDAVTVREQLEGTDLLVATVEITNLHAGEALPADYHPNGGLRRRLFRAGTTVVIVHSGYCYQGHHLLPGEPELDVSDHLKLQHDICNRGPERNQRWRDYREARTRERVEVWV